MNEIETLDLDRSPQVEQKYHNYVGNRIPWYLRLIWVLFWCFAVAYVINYLIPDIQHELTRPR